MEQSRPLDTLNQARNKKVMVELKNHKMIIGTLKAFDIHINIVLSDAEEHLIEYTRVLKKTEENVTEETTKSETKLKRNIGTVFVRGDTIITISPA